MNDHRPIPQADKCKQAVLTALSELGGRAERNRIVELAAQRGKFTPAERTTPAPRTKPNYGTYLNYKLSWALTQLRQEGLLENFERGWWRLAA